MSTPAEPRRTRTIRTDFLARVEGEGGMYVKIRDGAVQAVELRIYEPPRFFEALLRGRDFREAPDITSRICGICPIAYQTSAVNAIEDACGVTVDGPLRELRRLLYCGEWIESHALHVLMLHAPDFLGYESGIAMARDHAGIVQAGLQLKKAGNQLVAVIGGREIHPVNLRVGGFFRSPARREFAAVRESLETARETALALTRWVAGFTFPDFEQEYEFVALSHPEDYAIERGRIVSSAGLDIDVRAYDEHFAEEHVEHSNALHSRLRERGSYFVGPMARFALNGDRLSPLAREIAAEVGLTAAACRNPFRSILVRCVELVYACDEALRLIDRWQPPELPAVDLEPRAATGYGASEAPRGLLYHRYSIDADGVITDAQIVPPTSQNQLTIEQDLIAFVGRHHDLADEALTLACEQAIRNYDPCISCATHFLKLEVDRA
jgi:coenzyme F420-reducing hydrogenase alpha subunit